MVLTPTVIVTPNKASTDGALRSLEAIDLTPSGDATLTANRALVYGRGIGSNGQPVLGTATATPARIRNVRPGGGTPDFTVLGTATVTRAAELDAAAATILADYTSPDDTIRLTSRTFNASGIIAPGNRLWAWSPLDGVYDLNNQIEHRGQIAFPRLLRAAAVTTPITSDNGVYALLNDGATIIDLTPWVQYEDGSDTSWEVTPTARTALTASISSSVTVVGTTAGTSTRAAMVNQSTRIESDTTATTAGWTPAWTNLTVGTGGSPQNVGSYIAADGNMRLQARVRLGDTGAVTGEIRLALPPGWQLATLTDFAPVLGTWRGFVGGSQRPGNWVLRHDATTVRLVTANETPTSASQPGVWDPGDTINLNLMLPVEPV